MPLQRHWVREKLATLREDVPDAMLLLLPGDRLLDGSEALLYLMWRIWWAVPLAVIGSLPGVRQLLRRLYAWLARKRYAIGHACRIDGCS